MNFFSQFLRLSVLPCCRERPQSVKCQGDWSVKRLLCMRPCHFFRRLAVVRRSSPLSPMYILFHNIYGDACKEISYLNRSLKSSSPFVRAVNGRTSAALFACVLTGLLSLWSAAHSSEERLERLMLQFISRLQRGNGICQTGTVMIRLSTRGANLLLLAQRRALFWRKSIISFLTTIGRNGL